MMMTIKMKELRQTAFHTMVTSSIGALWCCKTFADSTWSPCAAMCNGVRLFFVLAVTRAPFSSSRSTTWSCPLRAAQCSGVRLSCSAVQQHTTVTVTLITRLCSESSESANLCQCQNFYQKWSRIPFGLPHKSRSGSRFLPDLSPKCFKFITLSTSVILPNFVKIR